MHFGILRAIGALPLFLAVLLGGCWFSPEPLLHAQNASEIPFAGTYADPEGGSDPVTILPLEANGYRLAQGGEHHDVFFLDIGHGWYVFQMVDAAVEPEDIESHTDLKITRKPTDMANYQLVSLSDGVVRFYKTECSDEIAEVSGVEKNALGCLIEDVAALRAAAIAMAGALVEGSLQVETADLRPIAE